MGKVTEKYFSNPLFLKGHASMASKAPSSNDFVMTDPKFATSLFSSTKWAWIWLIVRLYIGYEWAYAGYEKLINPMWMNGTALKGYWTFATAIPTAAGAKPAITFGWYRDFLVTLLNGNAQSWFAPLVAVGEFLVGVALILGLFTGIAALFGGFMNFNYMLAGTASTNPVLFLAAVLLILAWKTAGWWGLDRWVLPALGTPWRTGKVFASTPKKE
jgi:thiosulfate dehydrogenase [quinone] large subunit